MGAKFWSKIPPVIHIVLDEVVAPIIDGSEYLCGRTWSLKDRYRTLRYYSYGGDPPPGGTWCKKCLANPNLPLYILAATDLE